MSAATPRWPRVGWIAAALLGAAVDAGCAPGEPAPRPNVLLYVIDTLRADGLGAYGGRQARTPHIDRLASEGLLFEDAVAHSSWTRSSMASILTGRTPAAHGTEGRHDHLPALTTLAELLRRAGYATAFFNANPNAASFFGFARGFDEVVELHGRGRPGHVHQDELVTRSEEITEQALAWLARAPRPFLLVVLSVDPHYPYRRSPLAGRNVTAFDELLEMYRREIAANDAAVGALLAGLGEELDATFVILTSDHGEEFGEHGRFGHGRTLYEEVLRVPLILRYPPRIAAGQRSSRSATHVDLLPTILDVTGIAAGEDLEGRSLLAPEPASPLPALGSVKLDGVAQRSARLHPWKLLEDPVSGERRLYRLDRDPAERRPLELPGGRATREALERLSGALQRPVARAAPPIEPKPVPPEIRESLEALGYAEPEPAD